MPSGGTYGDYDSPSYIPVNKEMQKYWIEALEIIEELADDEPNQDRVAVVRARDFLKLHGTTRDRGEYHQNNFISEGPFPLKTE